MYEQIARGELRPRCQTAIDIFIFGETHIASFTISLSVIIFLSLSLSFLVSILRSLHFRQSVFIPFSALVSIFWWISNAFLCFTPPDPNTYTHIAAVWNFLWAIVSHFDEWQQWNCWFHSSSHSGSVSGNAQLKIVYNVRFLVKIYGGCILKYNIDFMLLNILLVMETNVFRFHTSVLTCNKHWRLHS